MINQRSPETEVSLGYQNQPVAAATGKWAKERIAALAENFRRRANDLDAIAASLPDNMKSSAAETLVYALSKDK